MSAAHTPGPWAFGSFGNVLVVPVIDGRPDKHSPICSLGPQEFPATTEIYANAALIAAAPQLLDALKDYVKVIATAGGGDKDLFMAAFRKADDAARAVIARAEGVKP